MNTKELTALFYKHCRNENKRKFIEFMTKKIELEQAAAGEVDFPAFMYAEDAYRQFLLHGYFDEYGRSKQMPNLLEERKGA